MKRYFGKHTRASAPRRGLVLAAALALTLIFSAGGTLAWLAAGTEETVNTFSPAKMEIEVKEDFEDRTVKKNVRVENESETAVYIRVALVPTWVNADGQPVAQSASLGDLDFVNLPASNWVKNGDYYYYTLPVPAGSETPVLFSSATVVGTPPEGCTMDLQVLAQAVQATPKDAVIAAWGLDPTTLPLN